MIDTVATAGEAVIPSETPREAARRLRHEMASIDQDIRACESELGRQVEDEAIQELVQRRERLLRRKEALPFLLRGVWAGAARAEAARLREQADDTAARLDAARAELAAAAAEFNQATAALARAAARREEATRLRDELQRQWSRLDSETGLALTDATRIEMGLEPFRSDRIDEAD